MKKRMKGPDGIILEIDTADAATPVMVYDASESYSSTYDCARGEGILAGRNGDIELSDNTLAWLAKHEDEAEAAYAEARKDDPDYQ